MTARKPRSEIEWVGGLATMPMEVTGDGAPYRPELLIWVAAMGGVLGHTIGRPGALAELAGDSLRAAIERPMLGRPHTPDRVRVASPELARALRAAHPGIEVVVAPTPEIDAIVAAMFAGMDEAPPTEQSYLTPDVDADAMAALFRAAAALFRAKPWRTVPADDIIAVGVAGLGVAGLGIDEAALAVIGQQGESLGFVLFPSIDDFEAFGHASDAMERGEQSTIPPHLALNFDRGAELSADLRAEIAEHRWEVASAAAYPWLVAADRDLDVRPTTIDEVTLGEAIALALPEFLTAKKALLAAWNGGAPVLRTLTVATHSGDVTVSLRVPFEVERCRTKPSHPLLAALFELEDAGHPVTTDARKPLEDALVQRFMASPEAKALTDIGACHFVMEFAAEYFDATIATLGPRALREILFDLIPRNLSVEPSAARWIIDDNRAFFAFLGRECGLEQADACLRVLGGAAHETLGAALADASKFGTAKALVMGGREAGFDMTSKEGVEAWMRAMQAQALPASVRLPSPGPRPDDSTRARTAKRAAKPASKARKKR